MMKTEILVILCKSCADSVHRNQYLQEPSEIPYKTHEFAGHQKHFWHFIRRAEDSNWSESFSKVKVYKMPIA